MENKGKQIKGFGDIFKNYGDALDIIATKQGELSVWKKDTSEVIKPLSNVDLISIDKNVKALLETYREMNTSLQLLELTANNLSKDNKILTKQVATLTEENESLKKKIVHIEELTDIISFTHSSECAELKKIAKRRVLAMLGGSVTDERYKLFYKKYIMNLYGYVKKELKVSSIDKIPSSKLEQATQLVTKWKPSPVFKNKLISDLVNETTPNKRGAFKVKVETVAQFNALMERYGGELHKYI